jgi:anti-anti-sigma factor
MIELSLIAPQFIAIEGELDTISAHDAETKLAALNVDLSGTVTFDLSDLTYISSSGLRFLLGVKKQATAAGGDVVLINLTDTVAKIFKVVGFDTIFLPASK